MKNILISIVLLPLLAFAAAAQEDVKAKHAGYYLCIDNIEKEPHKAYGYCSDYLKKYPDDDRRLTEFAGLFVAAYEKIARYIKSVPVSDFTDLTPKWAVYKPGLSKTIPITDDQKDGYTIVISRDYGSPDEEKLLNKAESLYTNPEKADLGLLKGWRYFAQPHVSLPEGEPKWWNGSDDTILSADLVTTEAVIYYYHRSMLLKNNDGKIKENSFKFISSNLKYEASLKKMRVFERGGKVFNNVYVANVTLTWGQTCGGLCGSGFTRNKVVVLGQKGEILEMFLDDPRNNMYWYS